MDDEEPARLGRVLDRETLDAASGGRARLSLDVPGDWAAGDELEVCAPARLVCARCEGGGCDGCSRSGALRAPDDAAARTVRLRLPELGSAGAAVRLVQPFGEGSAVEQVIVELRRAPAGAPCSPGVARIARPATAARGSPSAPLLAAVGALAALSAAAAALLSNC